MALANVGGALLGAVFGELLKLVIDAFHKGRRLRPELEKLKSTLESITPDVQEIERLNPVLDVPEREIAQLKDDMARGMKLVRKCSKKKWYSFDSVKYSNKLLELNESIETFCKVNQSILLLKESRKMSIKMDTVLSIVSKIERSGGGVFNGVVIDGPCSAPDPPEITPGLDIPLKELRMELVQDGGKQVIVVSAPGGSGKTTLLKKLCADNKVKAKFQGNIFFVTVSKTPDVKVIVQRIFQHKCRMPMFQTDEDAINDLERLLKGIGPEAILLVLDDVWTESLVHKFKFKLPSYKILVTSRHEFPQFGSGHYLKPLNDSDAMELFRSSLKPQDGDLCFFDENLANKILRVCRGSPLALTVVGRSLCGQPAAVWQSKEWNHGALFSSETDLLLCLKSSLDALDDKTKECYMDLGSFPEDQRIPITALIDMWTELYEWDDENGHSTINYLQDLSKRNLVNLVIGKNATYDGCYDDHFIMQHDLLRDLIIHQSMSDHIEQRKRLIIDIRGNKFPKWWSQKKQTPNLARLLSISTDETFSSNWYDIKAPEVEVVVLNLRTKEYTLPNFVEKMSKLKVLIITNYGILPTELSNFTLLGSDTVSNLTRIRLEHISIPSFGVPMKNLQKISLVMCNVGQAFRSSSIQISNAFPNLLEFEIDYCNDLEELPDGLFDIVSLKKLSITNCHKLSTLPEGISKLVDLEELRLASCTSLSALPDMVTELSKLKTLDISDCLSIESLPTEIDKLCSLETLCMGGCSSCELPQSVKDLKSLKVVKCDEETADQWETFNLFLPKNLKVEVVEDEINLKWLRKHQF